MHSLAMDWLTNPTFLSGLAGWTMAQLTKMLAFFGRTRRLNFAFLVSTGGMPSAHSAMCAALATSVALREGTGTPLFAVTLAFALVVMFDAQSVRRAAGLQAKLLNEMLDRVFKEHRLGQGKLVELLGHTRVEVFVGLVMGILVALLVHALTEGGSGQ